MKKTALIMGFLLICANLYAGTISMTYPDGEQQRILNGITKDGAACRPNEPMGPCAKRLILNFIKHEVTAWEDYKAKKAATDAVTSSAEPTVS